MCVAEKYFLLQPGLQRRERKALNAEFFDCMVSAMEVHLVLVEGAPQLLSDVIIICFHLNNMVIINLLKHTR